MKMREPKDSYATGRRRTLGPSVSCSAFVRYQTRKGELCQTEDRIVVEIVD